MYAVQAGNVKEHMYTNYVNSQILGAADLKLPSARSEQSNYVNSPIKDHKTKRNYISLKWVNHHRTSSPQLYHIHSNWWGIRICYWRIANNQVVALYYTKSKEHRWSFNLLFLSNHSSHIHILNSANHNAGRYEVNGSLSPQDSSL